MVSHMVFLAKLGFENIKNLVTPSPFCKVGRVTELLDGRVTSSPWKTKKFQGLDDYFGQKRPNHHLVPEYVHLFRAKKVWYVGRLFWEISSFMQNPDEVTRFDGTVAVMCKKYAGASYSPAAAGWWRPRGGGGSSAGGNRSQPVECGTSWPRRHSRLQEKEEEARTQQVDALQVPPCKST